MTAPLDTMRTTHLIAEWRDGNADAFAALVRRYKPHLVRWLKARVGRHHAGLNGPDDLAQLVLLDLHQQVEQDRTWVRGVATADTLKAALERLVFTRGLNAIQFEQRGIRDSRKTVHDQSADLPDGVSFIASREGRERPPQEAAVANLTGDEIRKHLAALDPEWAAVFEAMCRNLNEFRGTINVARVTAETGLSRRTVERAVVAIAAALRGWADDELTKLTDLEAANGD